MADAATWKKRVAAWRASGQTAAEYCELHSLTLSSLRHWSHRLGRVAPVTPSSSTVRLARVERVATESTSPPLTSPAVLIDIGSAHVRVERGVDAATVAAVLAALGAGARR